MNYLELSEFLTDSEILDVRINGNADEGLIFNIEDIGIVEGK